MSWTNVATLTRLHERGTLVAKVGSKQIALFDRGGTVYACNNRCPHEGFPLSEGTFDDGCVLTCNWHGWKFDLANGANLYGGDALRTYPVKVEGDAILVDLSDAPGAVRRVQAEQRLLEAFLDHDYDRIAREIVRFLRAGGSAEALLVAGIRWSHEKLEYGMGHAYAASEAWLRLSRELQSDDQRLVCLLEALGHMAFDTLREPARPYTTESRPYEASSLRAAIEAQDETAAIAQVNGALSSGLRFADIECQLTAAALEHYADFGHSLIYVSHVRRAIERLGPDVEGPLLRSVVRSLVYATREDLIPEFRGYARALARWPREATAAEEPPLASALAELKLEAVLEAVLEGARRCTPRRLYDALLAASALQLLRFDTRVPERTDNSVDENVGWLDLTHEITFANAVRHQCTRFPELWPRALLQMACFLGRNHPYLDESVRLEDWLVRDPRTVEATCIGRILDSGLDRYILSVHLLKTFLAAREELEAGPREEGATWLMAGINRFFHSPIKPRHVLRTARQALHFVTLEE